MLAVSCAMLEGQLRLSSPSGLAPLLQVSVALAMEVPPRPGVHGAVLDLMKTMTGERGRASCLCKTRSASPARLCLAGCRALHHFLFGVFLMLPPASCLLTQATLALLAWNPHGYCATEVRSLVGGGRL